jgi:hypothetical protein
VEVRAKKQNGKCWQFATLFVRLGHIAAASAGYAKGLSVICQSQGSKRQVLAKSAGSGEPVFTSIYATVQNVALKLPIFKQTKGCATISLGLNYCSMGSSQPPSRDTVP